jgi:hypothetical protein
MRLVELLGHHIFLRLTQRSGLRLRAALGERLREVGEEHREPQPQCDGENEARGRLGLAAQRGDPEDRGEHAAHVDAEHHRIAQLRARIELPERLHDGRAHERRIEHGTGCGMLIHGS